MEIFTEIEKDKIFVRFPELIPAVGEKYESAEHKKMLIVGECNYLEEIFSSQSDFQDAEKWYNSPNAKLIPDEKKKKRLKTGKAIIKKANLLQIFLNQLKTF